MMEIAGKHNKAKIFTDNIDKMTEEQVKELCNESNFSNSKIRIMPDCHAGAGCVIGTTMTITDKIVPNLVGVDIGCGMTAIMLNAYIDNYDKGISVGKEIDLQKMDSVIKKYIPAGFNVREKSMEDILINIFSIHLSDLKCKDSVNLDRAYKSVGTLGGGNHFIEIGEERGKYLIVHSGSRNLGNQIAQYYQNLAYDYCKSKYKDKYRKEEEKIINEKKRLGEKQTIGQELKKFRENRTPMPKKDLCYLEGNLLKSYLHDMDIAQKYAQVNRIVILATIIYEYLDKEKSLEYYIKVIFDHHIESVHNYLDLDYMILRKGAISAQAGELVLIPIDMKTGTIFGMGKGNADWNYSAPHGAGRAMGRKEAKRKLNLEEYKKIMEGVYTSCVCEDTLDEAPMAYKGIDSILPFIKDSVEVLDIFKTIYSFKATG